MLIPNCWFVKYDICNGRKEIFYKSFYNVIFSHLFSFWFIESVYRLKYNYIDPFQICWNYSTASYIVVFWTVLLNFSYRYQKNKIVCFVPNFDKNFKNNVVKATVNYLVNHVLIVVFDNMVVLITVYGFRFQSFEQRIFITLTQTLKFNINRNLVVINL